MNIREKGFASAPPIPMPAEDGFGAQFTHMATAFWATPERKTLLLLAALLIMIVGVTAYSQILLNAWNEPFYNAITQKDFAGFVAQLQVFAVLAGFLLTLNVSQVWLNQTIKLTMRKGLVTDLLNLWLKPERPFLFAGAGALAANPDQRLHADAHHLADLTIDLGVGLLQASLLLAAFIGVLWHHSGGMTLQLGGGETTIPGFMVWCALLYAAIASWLSWRVGRPMIGLGAERYAREGEMRFELVRINEEAEGIALNRGEARERARLDRIFGRVLEITRAQIWAGTRLTWVTAGYGWFTIVAPILAASPFYFKGDMTLGQLMLVVGAFNQVQGSLRWFVDNFPAIADWRATLLRVSTFRKALIALDRPAAGPGGQIRIERHEEPWIRIEGLGVSTALACVTFEEYQVDLQPGERLHIVGDYGAGKTLLFHALAGLWPWGTGRIRRPGGTRVLFLPARAYVAPGLLRDSVVYPDRDGCFEDAAILEALAEVGLEQLGPRLYQDDRWDKILTASEKQCLNLARALLHRPRWLIMDDAFHAIDASAHGRIEELFAGRLAETGMIYIGAGTGWERLFSRNLSLRPHPESAEIGPYGVVCEIPLPDRVRQPEGGAN